MGTLHELVGSLRHLADVCHGCNISKTNGKAEAQLLWDHHFPPHPGVGSLSHSGEDVCPGCHSANFREGLMCSATLVEVQGRAKNIRSNNSYMYNGLLDPLVPF